MRPRGAQDAEDARGARGAQDAQDARGAQGAEDGQIGDFGSCPRPLTVGEALASATSELAHAGCETPRLDAELLLSSVLGLSRERLLLDDDEEIDEAMQSALAEAVGRRGKRREPVAYITGRKHFWDIELTVDARALLPRPETELLVEVGLSLPPHSAVLDLGTGSGAIALALARARPDLEVWGSDISEQAIELARENGRRLCIDVRWLVSDLLEAVPCHIDAILCNPPYIAESERFKLPPELGHEPERALFAGADGLEVVRALMGQVAGRGRLRRLAIEVGEGQSRRVAEAMGGAGLREVSVLKDLSGIERVIDGSR